MKKINRLSLKSILLLVLAGCLLIGGALGTAVAAPLVRSEYYSGGVELYDIGVTLVENGTAVSSRNYSSASGYVWDESYGALLGSLVPEGEEFHMGQTYPEAISVSNSGSIDEFVRVSVYRYWQDKNGRKLTTLSPEMIDLHFTEGSGWVVDPSASSTERTVLYYSSVLAPGAASAPLTDSLTVNGKLPYKVTQSTKDNVITTTYDYEDVTFQIEVQADAVQTHSAEAAIKSAWGRTVTVSGDQLSLG